MKPETESTEEKFSVTAPKLSREEFLEVLREARAKIVALGVPLLSWDEVSDEVAAYRARGVEIVKLETKPQENNKTVAAKSRSRDEIIQRMKEVRAEIVASGTPFLTWEQLDCELAERRRYDEDNAR